MNVGNMRERVIIKGYTTVTSATGAETKTEATVATVWASVKPVRGRETQDAGRLAAIQTYLIKIHQRDLGTANFITWGTKDMQIKAYDDRWEKEKAVPGMFWWLECEHGSQV